MINSNERNNIVDCLKGSLILLVILGHVIQYGLLDSFDENIIFRVIYSFHMPAFITVSGYIYAYSKIEKVNTINFIKKNIYRLILPFISWYIIKYFIEGVYNEITFLDHIKNVIISPDYGLWFLWIIFLLKTIFFISQKGILAFNNKFKIELIVLTIMFFIINIIPYDVLGIGLLKKYYKYFLIGYLINRINRFERKIKINKIIIYISMLVFLLLAIQWYRVKEPLFYENIYFIDSILLKKIIFSIYNFITAILGTLSIYEVTKYIVKKKVYTMKIFEYLGKNTLGIYAIHYYFIALIKSENLLVSIIMNFIVAIVFSIIILVILRKFKMSKILLLGER